MGKYSVALAGQNRALIERALSWLIRFQSDINVERAIAHIEIVSPSRDAKALALLWKATLLTELRHEASSAQRRRSLEELVRR